MADPIATALARGQVLDDPNILREDKPPILEFARETREDRMTTIKTGRFGFRDAIVVYVRAPGDQKTRVPFIVWEKVNMPAKEMVAVRKAVPVVIREVGQDGMLIERTVFEERDTMEERDTFSAVERWPWFDQLDEKLRNGRISQTYRDHCRRAFEQWRSHGDVPLDGTPVAGWVMASPAQQATLINAGINTVEKVASMTEEGVQAIGMGARELKKKAENYLKADDKAAAGAQITRLENALAEKEEAQKTMAAKLAALESRMQQFSQDGKRAQK